MAVAYDGQDCAFALHDALLEAGHAELAEHFREGKSHPKGLLGDGCDFWEAVKRRGTGSLVFKRGRETPL
jgi:hypothetical protein